jgi:hypothetical protein
MESSPKQRIVARRVSQQQQHTRTTGLTWRAQRGSTVFKSFVYVSKFARFLSELCLLVPLKVSFLFMHARRSVSWLVIFFPS